MFNIFLQKNRKQSGDPFLIQPGNNKDKKLKLGYRLNWTEQIFAQNSQDFELIGKNFNSSLLPKLALLFFFFLSMLIARSAWLQIVKGEYYYDLAEGNRIRIVRVEAKRGVIYDRNRQPLVRNAPNFLMYFVPSDLPSEPAEQGKIIETVSKILETSADNIYELLSRVKPGSLDSYQPLFIADNIPYDNAMKLYLISSEMPGVILTTKSRRDYLFSAQSLSHIIGYTGKINEQELAKFGQEYSLIDYLGKMGIENFWENELKGVNGKKQIEVDALGKEKKVINQEKAQDGHDLVLSIDSAAQNKLEEIIAVQLDKLNLTKAVAIVINPQNGEIIAQVNLPTFNSNSFSIGMSVKDFQALIENQDKPLFNRAINGEYPSGSTIKPVIAVAGLEDGIINENTSIPSNGGIRIGQWFFPDWKAGGHGQTNVSKAIAESVNTFFYYIGGGYNNFRGLGIERIENYAKLFGLGSQLGVDMPGEAKGFVPSAKWKEEIKKEAWYIGDTYHVSIGQGDLLVTPLQVANFTAFFANGGTLFRPHIVKDILDANGNKINLGQGDYIIKKDFIKKQNIDIVRQGMRQTVTSGSARSLLNLSVAVAGKTGTAQWSSKKANHAWFTGFAPFDQPRIAITVLIEEGEEGSSNAVPVAGEFIDWYFNQDQATSSKTLIK